MVKIIAFDIIACKMGAFVIPWRIAESLNLRILKNVNEIAQIISNINS